MYTLRSYEIKASSWLDSLDGGARIIFTLQFHSALVVCNTAMINRVFLSFSVIVQAYFEKFQDYEEKLFPTDSVQ